MRGCVLCTSFMMHKMPPPHKTPLWIHGTRWNPHLLYLMHSRIKHRTNPNSLQKDNTRLWCLNLKLEPSPEKSSGPVGVGASESTALDVLGIIIQNTACSIVPWYRSSLKALKEMMILIKNKLVLVPLCRSSNRSTSELLGMRAWWWMFNDSSCDVFCFYIIWKVIWNGNVNHGK